MIETLKRCSKCSEEKELTEFYKYSSTSARANLDGTKLLPHCKKCHAKGVMHHYKFQGGKEAHRNRMLLHYHGITSEKYSEMLGSQDGKCAGCKAIFKVLSVDHDHITGKIRGLLCAKCNTGLGMLNDSVETLNNLVRYLNEGSRLEKQISTSI